MERVLVKRLRRELSDNEMQFGFISVRGATDAVFILRKLQEEYHAKGESFFLPQYF